MAGKAGKKAAEMTRFFISEWLREPGTQQMLVNKANPFLKKGIDQVSTAMRPKLNYKTNRKDLDGGGLFTDMLYGFNYLPRGKGIDIHKAIGKLSKPKGGFTLPGHKYTGPYNPLEKQLRYDPETGEILELMVKPSAKTDAVAAQHDVDYFVCEKQKNPKKCKKKSRSQDGESFGFYSLGRKAMGTLACKKHDKYETKAWFGSKKRKKEMSDDWLSLLATELHKPVKRNFPKRRVLSNGIDEIWAADLVEIRIFSKWNKGIRYLLMVIDVFSKFSWIEPLKDKRGESVAHAFEKIFTSSRRHPRLLRTDRGSEFYNSSVKRLLSKHDILLYSTENEEKSSVVERWNQSIKRRLWKTFSVNNNTIYHDKLGKVVDEYNNSFHSSVKMTPVEARQNKNERKVFANLYGDLIYLKHVPAKFYVGEKVRISEYKRKLFDKGFTPNWTEEIFTVDEILNTNPVTYKLVDLQGEKVTGSFYEQELQKAKQETFRIEKIKRRDYKKKQALVKWKSYPYKFNSWVPLSELR